MADDIDWRSKRDAHALLSPSSSHRWLSCPASVQMSAKAIEIHGKRETDYATEGTHAHRRAELETGFAFGLITEDEYSQAMSKWMDYTPEEHWADMERYALLYVDELRSICESFSEKCTVLLEQRLETGVDFCWGTTDAVLLTPTQIHVVDYKYGQGVAVTAQDNPQLKLYALGAMEAFGIIGKTEIVSMSVFQPRLGQKSTYHMDPEDLFKWRDEVVTPAAELALGEDAPFHPSLDACRFCPAAGECKPRMLHMTRLDFGDPDLLSPEELSDALSRLSEIRDWCNAVDTLALQRAYTDGVHIPGWKVVRSAGKRSIQDHAAAIQILIDEGYTAEQVARMSTKTIGDLEKLVGKKELPDILGDLLVKGQGSPSMVPEDDNRPPISPEIEAAKEFS